MQDKIIKKDILAAVGTVLLVVTMIVFSALVIQSITSSAEIPCDETGSSSSYQNITPTSLTNTLTPVEEGITSSLVLEATNVSLSFDGDGDVVTFDIDSSKAVFSFWFMNDTTEWTNVIKNYDEVYVNNVLDGDWDYFPYYVSGDNVYLGKFDATTFFNGSIDNFQIYESKLSEAEVETIYNEGH